jgi:arginyl-tRNA synthetase
VARLQDSAGVQDVERPRAPDRVGVVRVLPPAGAPSPAAAEGSLTDVDPVVLRFELLRHPVSMPLTLHPEVLSRDAVVNPGYAVRHAADRCRRLLVNAADLGVDPDRGAVGSDALESPDAARLVAALSSYDEVVRAAATRSEPHRLVRHLEETADAVLALTAGTAVLPRGDEEGDDRHRALLLAVRAGGVVLRGGLSLLGLPEGPR